MLPMREGSESLSLILDIFGPKKGPNFGFWDQTFGHNCPLQPPPKFFETFNIVSSKGIYCGWKKNVRATDSENICNTLKFTHFY